VPLPALRSSSSVPHD